MRWLGWAFLYLGVACITASILQSIYMQSVTLLPLKTVLTSTGTASVPLAAVGQVPLALFPLLLGLGLLASRSRKQARLFPSKKRFRWN
jgi:hypothetical protein